jgi:signal transduction histidine kinase
MAAFFAVLVVVFATSAIVYDRLTIIEWAKDGRVHTAYVLDTLETVRDAMLEQETGVRGYMITGDERFLDSYDRGSKVYLPAIQQVKILTANSPAQQRRLDELTELANKWRSEFAEKAIALTQNPETRDKARALEASMVGKTTMDLVRDKAEEIEAAERELLARRDAMQDQAIATAYIVTILGGAVSLIVALLMGILLMRGIATPITHMTSAMTRLARGDTSVEVPGVGRGDEIGAMAESAEVFKDSMIERGRAQAELARAGRVTTMGQLVASISHEINQPLTGILTNSETCQRLLKRDNPDLDDVRDALSSITSDGKRAAKIIENIRALARKSRPQLAKVDINSTIEEILMLTRTESAQNNIVVRTDLSKEERTVFGDRIQLQQVVLNLIVNGIEAMNAVMDRPKVLTISSERSDGAILVAVKDTGPGIDPAVADRIFESLFTTKANGMGMGLSICRSIIEAHGGRLWASPNTPHGAIFQFTLPIGEGELQTLQQTPAAS